MSAPSPWHPRPPVLFAWVHAGDGGRIHWLHPRSLPTCKTTLPRREQPGILQAPKDAQTNTYGFAGFRACCLSLIKVPHFQNLVYGVTEALPDNLLSLDTGNQVKSRVQGMHHPPNSLLSMKQPL